MEQVRIPFNINLRPEIEVGRYKVVTRDWLPVRILCWNRRNDASNLEQRPILALVFYEDTKHEVAYNYTADGRFGIPGLKYDQDLFLVPVEPEPEPELTEFQKGVYNLMHTYQMFASADKGFRLAKKEAATLLDLAREQIEAEQRPEPYDPRYDKKYLDAKIKKATESWKGVNVDKYLDEVRGGETLHWRKGSYYIPSGGAMCLIRTKKDTPDNGYLYYVEYRMDIAEYEEFIPISELENLKTE